MSHKKKTPTEEADKGKRMAILTKSILNIMGHKSAQKSPLSSSTANQSPTEPSASPRKPKI